MLIPTTLILGLAGQVAAADAAVFQTITNNTPTRGIDAASTQRFNVSVRVVNRSAGRPAAGKVWFVDGDGVQVSTKSTLGATGWASIQKDPPSGTLPGTHRYWIRYGGSPGLGAQTSAQPVAFSIKNPQHDDSLNGTSISWPDYLNIDIGDVRGLPNWEPSVGNSWSQQGEDSLKYIFDRLADRNTDAFMVPGDLVNGRWGLVPDNNTGVFGPSSDPVAMLRAQAKFYYSQQRTWLDEAGLYNRFYPGVGDHDLGDNPWGNGTGYSAWKRQNAAKFRYQFYTGVLLNQDGTRRFEDRPVGTPFENTAYAAMINADTMLVTVDLYSRNDNDHRDGVDVGVFGGQLRWLDGVLGDARRSGVRWIIVQGHSPILPSKVNHSSGIHVEYGRDSSLWQVMKKHRVNLYISGEVHTTSRQTRDGITHIATGTPLNAGAQFMTINQYDDRLELEDVSFRPVIEPSEEWWQGGSPARLLDGLADGAGIPGSSGWSRNAKMNLNYVGAPEQSNGTLTVNLDGTASAGTGTFGPWSEKPTFHLPLAKTVAVGRSATMALAFSGGAGSDYAMSLKNSAPTVAALSNSTTSGHIGQFEINAKKPGTTKISVIAKSGGQQTTKTMLLTVEHPAPTINLPATMTLTSGRSRSIRLNLGSGDRTSYTAWSKSSNRNVTRLSMSGTGKTRTLKIAAVNKGTATASVTVASGGRTVVKKMTVRVKAAQK